MNGNIHGTPPSFIFQGRHSGPSTFCSGIGAALGKAPNSNGSRGQSGSNRLSTEKEDLDKYLAQSMTKLSVKDRETALEEVNGIASIDPEDPAALTACLTELNQQLASLKQGTCYELAEKMDRDYVTNRDFQIMFLRANRYVMSSGQLRYHPKRAAEHMKKFFETKCMLFGKDKLVKDITLDDLDEDDRNGLRRGNLQILPTRDRAGRRIVVNFRGLASFKSVESELRAKFYLFMSAILESEETQKKGVVVIFYTVGQYKDKSKTNTVAMQTKHVLALPYHWGGMQICCDDYGQYVLLRAFFYILPAHYTARVRVHYGTHLECLYALQGYGIPEGSVPISPTDSKLDLSHHTMWYQQQCMRDMARTRKQSSLSMGKDLEQEVMAGNLERLEDDFLLGFGSGDLENDEFSMDNLGNGPKLENETGLSTTEPMHQLSQQASRVPVTPQSTDVLFGQNHKLHPGNVRLHDIISKHVDEYENMGGRQRKIEFAGHLVLQIKAAGARFLQLDKSCMQWMEVSDTKARNKVAKAIRNRRRNTVAFIPP
eukprot:scaffold7564_cov117-Cylindrotheca_fusiformis.AAC.2